MILHPRPGVDQLSAGMAQYRYLVFGDEILATGGSWSQQSFLASYFLNNFEMKHFDLSNTLLCEEWSAPGAGAC